MVEAMIRRDIAEVEAKFAEVLGAPDPLAALRQALHERVAEECGGCVDGPLWAVSCHSPRSTRWSGMGHACGIHRAVSVQISPFDPDRANRPRRTCKLVPAAAHEAVEPTTYRFCFARETATLMMLGGLAAH